MANIYLVDFENVHYEGLKNASLLNKEDEIVIFYSNNADIYNNKVRNILKDCKSKVTTKEIYLCGKNSLDFQLVAYLGTRIKGNKDKIFYIVSKDKDYCSVLLFFQGIADIYLVPKILIDVDNLRYSNQESNLNSLTMQKLGKKLNEINSRRGISTNVITSIMINSTGLLSYHNDLVKFFNAETGGEIYKETKKFYQKIKKDNNVF